MSVGGWVRQPDVTPIPDIPASLPVYQTDTLSDNRIRLASDLHSFQDDGRGQVAIPTGREIKGESPAE